MTTHGNTLLLPRGEWLNTRFNEALTRALQVFPEDILPWVSLVVYDYPPPSHQGCDGIDCPVEASGSHPMIVMRDLIAASHYGPNSTLPRRDGLPTATLVDIKAHAVGCSDVSNIVPYQQQRVSPGHPNSFGGVLVLVPLPGTPEIEFPYFRFIVACSGGDKIDDQEAAERIGSYIKCALLREGVLRLAPPAGPTFINGLTTAEVARYASGAGA